MNKDIHIIFKMGQAQTFWDLNFQETRMNKRKKCLKKNKKEATEVAPFIYVALKILPVNFIKGGTYWKKTILSQKKSNVLLT